MIGSLTPRLRPAVSAYTGIIRSVEECLGSVTEPPFFQAACEVGAGDWLLGSGLDHLSGLGGIGRTREAAAGAAVGEALERYSATYVPVHTLVFASATELGEAAVAPARFALFSERQYGQPDFGYRRFTEHTRTYWVEGRELPGGVPAYLPAELVFLGPVPVQGVLPIGYATSSGLACGEELERTLEGGLLELLERDAFMIVWTNRLSLPLLGGRGCATIEGDDLSFSSTGLGYAAVDLSVFHDIPTVLGVVRAPRGCPGAVGVGAAAAPAIESARWKALAEAFAARTAGAKLSLLDPGAGARRGLRSFEDHIRHYARHEAAEATGFLDGSALRTEAGSVRRLEGNTAADRISALCRRIEAAGATAYAIDVTAPDVAELGLTVSRVIAPELCALDVAHDARFLGGRRLYEAAMKAGLSSRFLREEDINPDPHPFP